MKKQFKALSKAEKNFIAIAIADLFENAEEKKEAITYLKVILNLRVKYYEKTNIGYDYFMFYDKKGEWVTTIHNESNLIDVESYLKKNGIKKIKMGQE